MHAAAIHLGACNTTSTLHILRSHSWGDAAASVEAVTEMHCMYSWLCLYDVRGS